VIIKDSDYREVTRYALWCMASMEAFYARIYATRTFYWELRLPHPKAFGAFTRSYLENIWRKMRPEDNFKEHVALTGKPLRKVLRALASVQHACLDIAKESDSVKDFLKTYFEAFAVPAMRGDAVDWKLFQKELSMRIAPKVRAALPRTERVHFEDNDLAPRAREFDFDALDLDDDDFLELFDLHELLDTFELAQVSETSRLMLPAK
jgi:hypothetical protein